MARTESKMMPLGTLAPPFALTDCLSNREVTLADSRSDTALVIMFICNHCPFVKLVQHELVRLATHYQSQGVNFIAINSNDATQYPDDAPDNMKTIGEALGYPFPYLFDSTQDVAKAYDAACTPDFYIFDAHLRCAYRGQLDDSRPGNDKPSDGRDIRNALDAIIAGNAVNPDQKPSLGCNIKWK